jgi:hypothetical protein
LGRRLYNERSLKKAIKKALKRAKRDRAALEPKAPVRDDRAKFLGSFLASDLGQRVPRSLDTSTTKK